MMAVSFINQKPPFPVQYENKCLNTMYITPKQKYLQILKLGRGLPPLAEGARVVYTVGRLYFNQEVLSCANGSASRWAVGRVPCFGT